MAELFERKPNPLFYANLLAKERIVVNQGGTYSSKSYSIMQVLVALACSEVGRVIVVAGGTIPKLKDDVMKIMAEIVSENPNVKRFVKNYNIQDRRYDFTTRSTIEFKSYENYEDAKGGKFDYLYISEATRFEYATCEILMRNTKFKVFLDYNPTARFWVHDILMTKKVQYPSVKLIRSWHEHNLYLSEEKHREIESIEDPDMWKVYARGLTGKLSGLVFRWTAIDKFPVEGVQELIWGLDFGYTQDPTALTKVAVMKNGSYVVQELTYQPGIAMEDIYEIARRNGYYHDQPVYCDHDKELILQLRRLSMLALGAEKGEVLNGILYCKQKDIRYTVDSRNLANELMRYKFLEVNGVATNKPVDAWNHLCDSVRYAIFSHRNRLKLNEGVNNLQENS